MRARIESLERENERLREENEANDRESDADERTADDDRVAPAARAEPRGSSQPRGRWAVAKATLAVIGLVGAGVLAMRVCSRHVMPVDLRVRDAIILPASQGGGTLAVYVTKDFRARADNDELHLIAFDLATGDERGQIMLADEGVSRFTHYQHAGPRAWMRNAEGELVLLDLETPAVVLPSAAIAAQVPELSQGYRAADPPAGEYLPSVPAAAVTLHDGSQGWVDQSPAFVRTPPPAAPWRPGYYCDPDWGLKGSCVRRECVGFAPGPEGEAMVLGRLAPWPTTGTPTEASPAASPLLRPGLVRLLGTSCAFESEGHVLVLHDSAAFEPKESLLSLLDSDGTIAWTLKLEQLTARPGSEALGAVLREGGIDLLLSEDEQTLDLVRLGLDGEILSRHELF